jgi:PAS domain S-box-containing protein
MYRIFGLNPQEPAPDFNEFLSYIHPDDRGCIDKIINKRSEGVFDGIDYRIILADGQERTVYTQTEAIFNEKNVPIRVKGIVQDITERKKAEEKIESLANIVESSNDAIITKSFEGIITSWNKGAEQVYGYLAEEIMGKSVSILEPDNLKGEIKLLGEKVKQGKRIQNYETSRLRKDGTIINVSLTLSPVFDSSRKLVAISAIARDITESKRAEEKLRESEEKYRNIVEIANEGILVIDDKLRITYYNKKLSEMLGYNSDEGIGRPIWDYIREENKVAVKQNMEKRRQGINEPYELELICKDGSSLWVLINSKSLHDKNGKFLGSISMLTDITERKIAEDTLAKIETARKKEIHHRIKNNLQVISSLLDLQAEKFRNRKDIKDSEVLESFKESQDRVISMALIHEELHKGGDIDTLNFSKYVEDLADNLTLTYKLGNAKVILDTDIEDDIFFDMDTSVPLGMIINELVSNSLKHAFSGRDKGLIRIKLHKEECESEGNTSYVMSISDNGVGIPENLDIKELDTLGMQLVTSLVDQLDGELELKRNNGTEFIMRFTVKNNTEQASLPSL